MFESPVSKKIFLAVIIAASLLTCLTYIFKKAQSRPILVFCDVGQGDGAYIRLENEVDIVIDAGPDKKILDCLGKYMPFYDKTIEYAFISHPQRDHYGGYLYLLDRYTIKSFWMTKVNNQGKIFSQLKNTIREKEIPILFPKSGDRLKIYNTTLVFFWPNLKYLEKNSISEEKTDRELRVTGYDVNNFSLIFLFSRQNFNTLFTGDIPGEIINGLSELSKINIDILKIPHHGSKNGLSVGFFKLAHPTYGVISVGKTNSYGHPSKDILATLEASEVKIKRTDIDGDIVFSFN